MRPTECPHILWNIDKDLPCISGTRLRVQDVVQHHLGGHTLEEIEGANPTYSRAEILSALPPTSHLLHVRRPAAARRQQRCQLLEVTDELPDAKRVRKRAGPVPILANVCATSPGTTAKPPLSTRTRRSPTRKSIVPSST
jgi:hypothetical protein